MCRVQLGECLKTIIHADYPEQWPHLLDWVKHNLQDQQVYGALFVLRILSRKYEWVNAFFLFSLKTNPPNTKIFGTPQVKALLITLSQNAFSIFWVWVQYKTLLVGFSKTIFTKWCQMFSSFEWKAWETTFSMFSMFSNTENDSNFLLLFKIVSYRLIGGVVIFFVFLYLI